MIGKQKKSDHVGFGAVLVVKLYEISEMRSVTASAGAVRSL